MKHLAPFVMLAGTFLLALAGCQNHRVALRELQRENFLLGEQLTQMEILLADYEAALRRCRSKLKQPDDELPPPLPEDKQEPPFQPPKVDLGTPQTKRVPQHAPRLTDPAGRTARGRNRRLRVARSTARYGAAQLNTGRMIARLKLDPGETQAVDTDGDGVADLVQVALLATDSLGRLLPPVGELSLAVVDHHYDPPRRLARWDYSAEALRLHVVRGDQGPMALLRLTWEGPPPRHEKLRLYVRLLPGDGRRLQAEHELVFPLEGGSSSHSRSRGEPRPLAAKQAPRYGHRARSSQWAPPGTFSWRGGSQPVERVSPPGEHLAAPARSRRSASAPAGQYRRSVERPRWRPYR